MVGVHDGIFGNEVALVNIIFECDVRHTQRSWLAPAEDFLDSGTEERQLRHILDLGETVATDAVDLLLDLGLPGRVVAHGGEEAVKRAADRGNGDEGAGADSVGGLVPVQSDVGFIALTAQPELAPAVLGSAICDAVLDVLESLVESILDTLKLFGLFLLERRDGFREVLEEGQFVDDWAGRRDGLEQVGNHGEQFSAMGGVTPGNTGNRSGA